MCRPSAPARKYAYCSDTIYRPSLAEQIKNVDLLFHGDQIPEKLTINVDHLGLGKTMQVGALHFEGLELMNAKNAVVCAVQLTRAARGAQAKG